MKTNATAQQVARLAQVSQSAVSRTFTEGASVAPETKRKVLEAAQALGYRPNAIARSLTTRRSRIVALVMSYLENQFYPLVIEQLSQKLQKRGYHVLMFISDMDEADGVLDEILQYQVDGIVMASTTLSAELTRRCTDSGVPIVLFNRVPDMNTVATHSTSSVTCDNHEGGRLVAEHLLAKGHRKIAYLAGLENSSTNIDRERGFVDALRKAGLALHSRGVGDYDFERARQATRELCATHAPTALFVANDHMAIAAMDEIRFGLGLRIPDDISVVGFDDVPQAAWGSYQLTTVIQSVPDMVDATVSLLAQQMQEDGQPGNVVIPCRLVERASVKNLSAAKRAARSPT